ncbi:MAG: hypothetical protein MUF18_13280 [Fimbriiglobus sp.]|jgi:hypothetical protein|nr:hypothetical protein [Fimbriiglobus sp.]
MTFDLKSVAEFVRKAETEDLLDRVTVYREAMEPAAVDLMENELWRRGLSPQEVAEHASERSEVVRRADGSPIRCTHRDRSRGFACDRPAVSVGWHWFRLWGRVPVVPWPLPRCKEHGGGAAPPADGGE